MSERISAVYIAPACAGVAMSSVMLFSLIYAASSFDKTHCMCAFLNFLLQTQCSHKDRREWGESMKDMKTFCFFISSITWVDFSNTICVIYPHMLPNFISQLPCTFKSVPVTEPLHCLSVHPCLLLLLPDPCRSFELEKECTALGCFEQLLMHSWEHMGSISRALV